MLVPPDDEQDMAPTPLWVQLLILCTPGAAMIIAALCFLVTR
jgi:hypothetical protein